MARVEGAVRMKRVGKFLVFGGLTSIILSVLTQFVVHMLPIQPYHPPVFLPAISAIAFFYLGIFPMIAGGALWVGGWIVEGFLTPQRTD